MTKGILFSQMIPQPGDEERFNIWYNEDHVPARMVLPHFLAGSRFEPVPGTGTPDFLAIYEVEDLAAFQSEEYKNLKKDPSGETTIMLSRVSGFTRYISELIDDTGEIETPGAYLSVVAFSVPDDEEEDFNNWYAGEHIPMLMKASDWPRVRRYKVIDGAGGPWTHIALHEIANLDVMDSPERAAARKGPVRRTLVDRDWFSRSGRWLYKLLSQQHAIATAKAGE
ncbi:hypothetical protein AAHB37_15505 [Glutamicibacter halophytocola]|uniref:hypothetical protein n=1 Tax=Glutamicibacter halophytocola TaxID=1933880 RepID=UPI00321BFF0D